MSILECNETIAYPVFLGFDDTVCKNYRRIWSAWEEKFLWTADYGL